MPLPLLGAGLALATEFAPSLIRMFAGDKAGAVADQVVGAAKQITGRDDPDEAAAALRADPEMALAFKRHMADIEVRLEEAYLADRQNARARDIELRKAGERNWRADVMILAAAGALVFVVWQVNTGASEKSAVLAIYNMAIGALLKMLGDAFHFEFGSSRGSKEKDARR